jgi:hypothetical protein
VVVEEEISGSNPGYIVFFFISIFPGNASYAGQILIIPSKYNNFRREKPFQPCPQ